jgi:hypothetical protein
VCSLERQSYDKRDINKMVHYVVLVVFALSSMLVMYALIYSLFVIFTLLVYLRGNDLVWWEFTMIVTLLCYILWILYNLSRIERFVDVEDKGEDVDVEDEDDVGRVSWKDVADLPTITGNRILRPIKEIVLGMKGKSDASDPATNIDLDDQFLELNRDILSGFAGIDVYKDANYALSRMRFGGDDKMRVIYTMLKNKFGADIKIVLPKEES